MLIILHLHLRKPTYIRCTLASELHRIVTSIISANQKEINYILGILENNSKEFPIFTQKLAILDSKIKEYIAKYHNTKIGGYSGIGKIFQKVRQHCQFPRIKQEITKYI